MIFIQSSSFIWKKIIISNNVNEEKIDTNLNIKISSINFVKNNNEF